MERIVLGLCPSQLQHRVHPNPLADVPVHAMDVVPMEPPREQTFLEPIVPTKHSKEWFIPLTV